LVVKSTQVRLGWQAADLDLQATLEAAAGEVASVVEAALEQRIHQSLPSNTKDLDNTCR
jgi:hypothetical protein